jgi:hypothetical protein
VTDVKVYSNAGKVELFVNGKSKGPCKNDGNAVFVWKAVKLSPGANRIEARAQSKGKALNDDCVWTVKN